MVVWHDNFRYISICAARIRIGNGFMELTNLKMVSKDFNNLKKDLCHKCGSTWKLYPILDSRFVLNTPHPVKNLSLVTVQNVKNLSNSLVFDIVYQRNPKTYRQDESEGGLGSAGRWPGVGGAPFGRAPAEVFQVSLTPLARGTRFRPLFFRIQF